MVTRINKISAIFATVAIFFFAAFTSAQAALDKSLDLNYEVSFAQYNQDNSLFSADALSNPWGVQVGDIITATIQWRSAMVNPALPSTSLLSTDWKFSLTLGEGDLRRTINGATSTGPELYFTYGQIDDYFSLTYHDSGLYIFAGLDSIDIGTVGGANLFAIQALRTELTPNPVPLPPAVWLLGSGLIGMVGMRRKMKK